MDSVRKNFWPPAAAAFSLQWTKHEISGNALRATPAAPRTQSSTPAAIRSICFGGRAEGLARHPAARVPRPWMAGRRIRFDLPGSGPPDHRPGKCSPIRRADPEWSSAGSPPCADRYPGPTRSPRPAGSVAGMTCATIRVAAMTARTPVRCRREYGRGQCFPLARTGVRWSRQFPTSGREGVAGSAMSPVLVRDDCRGGG